MGEHEYRLVGKGLRLVYRGEIIRIAFSLMMFLLETFYLPLLGFFGALGAAVGGLMALEGLNKAGDAHENYRAALTLLLTERVFAIVSYVAGISPVATVLTLLNSLFYVLAIYFICQTSGMLLREKGEEKLARQAGELWKVTLLCRTAETALFAHEGLTFVLSLVSLVVLFLRLGFYMKACRVLME